MENQNTIHVETPSLLSSSFSYYSKPISNTIPESHVAVIDVYNLIRGDDFIAETQKLRGISDTKVARKYKAYHFNYVTFSGTFSKRNNDGLIRHSGLLTIDFDHLVDIIGLKDQLLVDPYFETQLLFTSPSGDGLKWIIPIDPSLEFHHKYFDAVSNYVLATYNLVIDPNGREVSRACFLPHDSEAYINPKYL